MTDRGPPPKFAVKCPSGDRHTAVAVRRRWFYCGSCQQRYREVIDDRTGDRLTHDEFIDQWGVVSYRDHRL